MEASKVVELLQGMDSLYGTKVVHEKFGDPEEIKAWCDRLSNLPFNRVEVILESIEELKMQHKIPRRPSLAEFIAKYMTKYGKASKTLKSSLIPETDCCHLGHRYLLLAGHHPHMKPLNIRKMSCQEDDAGTTYEHYTVQRVPCSCQAGQLVNSKTAKYDYTFDILRRFYDNSFPTRTAADEFFQSKVFDKELIH